MQRNHPFGYQMENGVITVDKKEKQVVIEIFKQYVQGQSYQKIADNIQSMGIAYHIGKDNWNKNMIARLLGNLKYLGNDQYPPLISQELFEQAQHKKLQKPNANPVNINPLKEIKELLVCKECGGNIQRRTNGNGTERWFCVNDHRHISTKVGSATILKEIKDCLQQFTIHGTQFVEPTDTEEINRVTQEIERLLLQGSSNDEFLQMMIRDIAQKRYQNSQSYYGVAAYRQNLLKEILSSEALDSNKISQLLCKIEVDFIGNLTLHERRA